MLAGVFITTESVSACGQCGLFWRVCCDAGVGQGDTQGVKIVGVLRAKVSFVIEVPDIIYLDISCF